MKYELNTEMVQRIILYLAEFPYKEVADIIDCLKEQFNKYNVDHDSEDK